MTDQEMDALIEKLKHQVIEALNLEDVRPSDIDPDAPLFGGGLGLDSINALELVVLLEKEHGISIQDMGVAKDAFASLRSLGTFIREHRG